MSSLLIADSGSTKTTWCRVTDGKKKMFATQGISPYFLDDAALESILRTELLPKLQHEPDEIFYYGTGCSNTRNVSFIKKGLKKVFRTRSVQVDHDLTGAARALCGHNKGIACILGTGSNSGYYDGNKIVKNSPGLGYILGDEGSGAFLGKKVLQHYLYNTFDDELLEKFRVDYPQTKADILDNVYKMPLPNRYLAGFTTFLAENRGHFMVENILEDSFNEFFFTHLYKYRESWTSPINFCGSVAFGFKDVLLQMCAEYEMQPGKILKNPIDGLVQFHSN